MNCYGSFFSTVDICHDVVKLTITHLHTYVVTKDLPSAAVAVPRVSTLAVELILQATPREQPLVAHDAVFLPPCPPLWAYEMACQAAFDPIPSPDS
jgi:hypothetical protein